MAKTFVIGDIHGALKALQQVLERAAVSTNDTLIFLGDYVDGWSESPAVLDLFIAISHTHNCIFLRGNHDELALHWLQNNHDNPMWYDHGGESTVKAYQNVSEATKQKHIAFLLSIKNYHLDEKNRLFIHAGFTNLKGVTHEHFPRLIYWDRTLWEMALSLDNTISKDSIFYPKRLKLYHEIYIGHTPVTQINQTIPINKANIWNIDTGAAFKGPLTILDIDSKEFWQSDPVYLLYPNEMGRN
ncbi:serine/threonine protein phosphatase [Flavobacterium amnicola]|uniref:Serine/threonine protein phosphatase n=1 Tax=Flavobacterium amnicola TaxID=2506422 RepID=A0A4Q1K5U3_9FLAO|nr:metallophosphoesterase [Flavobacterium amnicola]RXR20880.1 serine/threonine protein phosphatase [Flavobacterium amnicola]